MSPCGFDAARTDTRQSDGRSRGREPEQSIPPPRGLGCGSRTPHRAAGRTPIYATAIGET